jgi:hypothetical protein
VKRKKFKQVLLLLIRFFLMDSREELVIFLEQHPECYPIMKSALFIELLSYLEKQASTIEQLSVRFRSIEEKDIEQIVLALKSLNVVSQTQTPNTSMLFYANDAGRELLQKYRKAKKEFKVLK